jgi:hypothetical protein
VLLASVGVLAASGVGAVAVAALRSLDPSGALLFVAAVASGALAGALIGAAQAGMVHDVWPPVTPRRWVIASAVGIAAAVAAGMAPRALRSVLRGQTQFLLGVLFLLLLLTVLVALGAAQWFLLRHHVERATTWIWGVSGGWLLGLFLAAPVWGLRQRDQSASVAVVIGVLGLVIMAVTMASIGAGVLLAMSRRGPPRWS